MTHILGRSREGWGLGVEGQLESRVAGQVPDVVRAGVPGFQVRSVVLIGEGVDHVAYGVNGELVGAMATGAWARMP